MRRDVPGGIVLGKGEGESLSHDRDYLIKAAVPELSLLESFFPRGEEVKPHVHERHTDSFYVLEGELEFALAGKKIVLVAGAFLLAPPGVVHSFSVASADGARWLNLHAPDAGFVESRRAGRDDREPRVAFDVFEPPPDGGRPATQAIVRLPGEGERLVRANRVVHVKAALPQLAVLEFEVDGDFASPDLHTHDDHTVCFYVLEGELEITVGGETFSAGAGTFVAAPPGVEHAVRKPGSGCTRFLNIHAPDAGFADRLRRLSD